MKLTLGRKLGLGFGVVLSLMIFSAVMTYLRSVEIRRVEDTTVELRFPAIESLESCSGI